MDTIVKTISGAYSECGVANFHVAILGLSKKFLRNLPLFKSDRQRSVRNSLNNTNWDRSWLRASAQRSLSVRDAEGVPTCVAMPDG